MDQPYLTKNFAGKNVYIVEKHHYALLPWSFVRQSHDSPLRLISLDHHTDTRPAFWAYSFSSLNTNLSRAKSPEGIAFRKSLIENIDFNIQSSICDAISYLRHDEHIHTAIESNIISHAFIIQLMDFQGTQPVARVIENKGQITKYDNYVGPEVYEIPEDKMFIVPNTCLPTCKKDFHDDHCGLSVYDNVIADEYLEFQLEVAQAMSLSCNLDDLLSKPYILDIDLDYFHTRKSINPDKKSKFESLVRGASAITIALEEVCVEDLQINGEELTSKYLLNCLLGYISEFLEK